jgi:hypothetical protein
MRVLKGRVLTPKRERLITNYVHRHSWVHHWPGNGRGPAFKRWTDNERRLFVDWEEGFLMWQTEHPTSSESESVSER